MKIRHILYLAFYIFILSTGHSFYAMKISPFLHSIFQQNDNFKMETFAPQELSGQRLNGGLHITHFFNSELEFDLSYSHDHLNEEINGDYVTTTGYGKIEYLLLPNVKTGVSYQSISYRITNLTQENYDQTLMKPFILYYHSPKTLIKLYYGLNDYNYVEETYSLQNIEYGIDIKKRVFSWLSLNSDIKQSMIRNSGDFQEYNFNTYTLGLALNISKKHRILVQGIQKDFLHKSKLKKDEKDILLSTEYNYLFNDNIHLSLNAFQLNQEKINNEEIENTIFTAALTIKPSFGSFAKNKTRFQYLLSEAKKAREEKHFNYAEKTLLHLDILCPNNLELLKELAVLYYESDKNRFAREVIKKIIALGDDDLSNIYFLAYHHIKLEQYKKSLSTLEVIYELTKDDNVKKLINIIERKISSQ